MTELLPFSEAWTARKKVILHRSSLSLEEIKRSARAVHPHRHSSLHTPPWIARALKSTAKALSLRMVLASYMVIAFVPTVAAALYYGFVASNQYVSEAKFALHSGERSSLDPLAVLSVVGSLQQVQNSLIVADFIKSRAIVASLDKRLGLRKMFSQSGTDWISRFSADGGIERLTSYWRWKVKTAIEMPSGIIAVEVCAFSPEDSLRIANAVVALSEDLVNGMTRRSRHDQLDQAKAELDRTQHRLQEVENATRALRDRVGIIDPSKQAEGIGRVIEQLRLTQIRTKEDLASENLSTGAPQIKVLQSHISAMESEIENLQKLLTDTNEKAPTISHALVQFDRMDLDRKIASSEYLAAAASYERARVESEQQQVYLDAFVTPVLAQESLYPHRFLFALATGAASHLAWLLALAMTTRVRQRFGR